MLLLASAATLIGGAAFAQSLLGQSQPNQDQTGQGSVVVPPAPPVVAAPATPVPPPVVVSPAPPPGLVQTPVPPPDVNSGNADNGSAPDTDDAGAQAPSAAPTDQSQPDQSQGVQPQVVSPSSGPAAASNATPAQPAPPDEPPTPDNSWVQGKTVVLGVLNKVDGSTTELTIPVGGQATAGDLIVSVQACVSRPPGQLPDAAVFLTLQQKDSQDGSQVYKGWMVRSSPGAADAGNAGQAFRVITCS